MALSTKGPFIFTLAALLTLVVAEVQKAPSVFLCHPQLFWKLLARVCFILFFKPIFFFNLGWSKVSSWINLGCAFVNCFWSHVRSFLLFQKTCPALTCPVSTATADDHLVKVISAAFLCCTTFPLNWPVLVGHVFWGHVTVLPSNSIFYWRFFLTPRVLGRV